MGKVYLNPMGDGSAYCVPAAGTELANGERFEIFSVPYSGASLEDIRAFDSHDYAVAIPTSEHISMPFRSAWGNLYVDIYFSNSPTPPTPPPPTPSNVPVWLLKKAAENNAKIARS